MKWSSALLLEWTKGRSWSRSSNESHYFYGSYQHSNQIQICNIKHWAIFCQVYIIRSSRASQIGQQIRDLKPHHPFIINLYHQTIHQNLKGFSMSLQNVWHSRKVADNASKSCWVCFKPTTTVLITPDNKVRTRH